MTWTYVPDFTIQRDRVRRLIGDVDPNNPLLTDEELALWTTGGAFAQGNDFYAAAEAADAIAGSLARGASSLSAGGTSVTFRNASEFTSLAAMLRRRGARSAGGTIVAGGISQTAKDVQTDNTDTVSPAFTRSGGDPFTTRTTRPGEPEQYGVWG